MSSQLKHYLRFSTGLGDLQIESVAAMFKPFKVKRNEIILPAGEVCKDFYFISKGCVRVYYLTKDGREKTRYIAVENSVFTAISSFITQQPSFEYLEAVEESELQVISHQNFTRLLTKIPAWAQFYIGLLEMAYVFQNKKIEQLVTLTAKQRYDDLMQTNPVFIRRLSNSLLASYLDISPETLSRLKSK